MKKESGRSEAVTPAWEKLLFTQALSCPTSSCPVVSGLLGVEVFASPVISYPTPEEEITVALTAEAY